MILSSAVIILCMKAASSLGEYFGQSHRNPKNNMSVITDIGDRDARKPICRFGKRPSDGMLASAPSQYNDD